MGEGEDRLQLLHRWLTCDEAAGYQLWSGPGGLFEEYCMKGKEWGLRYVYKLRRWGVRIDHEQYLAFEEYEMEGLAADQLSDIHDRLKPKEANPEKEKRKSGEKGKKPEDFPTLEDFHAYISVSLRQGIKDVIKDHLGLDTALVSLLDDEEEENGWPLLEILSSPEETPEEAVMAEEGRRLAEERQRLATALLQEFQNYLAQQKAEALLKHLALLIEAVKATQDKLSVEAMAEKHEAKKKQKKTRKQHPELRDYCRSKGVNDATYDCYNRRLRHQWRVFCEGRGKALYQQYEETRWTK